MNLFCNCKIGEWDSDIGCQTFTIFQDNFRGVSDVKTQIKGFIRWGTQTAGAGRNKVVYPTLFRQVSGIGMWTVIEGGFLAWH